MMKPFPLVLASAICASLLHAQGVVPTDLPPGSPYRVLVVTDSVRDATSTDIADYDAHVAADVAGVPGLAALGVNWRALASTPTVDANAHTATNTPGGVPIYLSNGQRIFDDYDHLWGYPIAPLRAPDVTSSGLTAPVQVWSGTDLSGVASGGLGYTLGAGVNSNLTGFSNVTNFQWLYGTFVLQTEERPLYGLSDVVTVPFTAKEEVRAGTPSNPLALLPGQTSAPIIGQTWDPIVDHTNFVANPALDIGVFSNTQANIPHPQFGTILCGQWNNSLSIQPGQAFDIPIVNDVNLLGAQLTMQCITLDYSWGLHLTNALDITVGSQ